MADARTRTIDVVDMHTSGEPVRIITGGYPMLEGKTILAQRREARDNHDDLRRALMLEPRGHAGMYGVVPVQPSHPEAEFACLFIHNEGYSTMCGHATIALGKWLVESGRVERREPESRFIVELPCGLVEVTAQVREGKVVSSAFVSVPAWLAKRDVEIDVARIGRMQADLCYGGAYYLVLPASRIGLSFDTTPLAGLVAAGVAITEAGRAQIAIDHPEDPDLAFLYGTILTDDAAQGAPSFNLCIFADGQVDRSPTGSGVTARLARDFARGLVRAGEERTFYGPTPVPFHGEIVEVLGTAANPSVKVKVSGSASFVGSARLEIHSDDPLAHGFALPATFGALRAGTGG